MKKIFTTILFIILTVVSFSKNIYVVYDDSLSMKKDYRSVYANYAMQTLIALQESKDNMVITRMSDYKNDFRNKLFIDLKDIPKEISYFKDNINPKSMLTPYKAVETMLDYINSIVGEDETGWLIIISDGYFEDGKPIPEIETIKRKVKKIAQEKNIKPIFLLIGSNNEELDNYENQEGIKIWKEAYGKGEYPKIYKSVGKQDIVDKMGKIAQLLTNKSESRDRIYKIDGNKVIFSPDFPLKKIILLEQGDIEKNGIKKVTVNGEKVTDIDSYSLKKEMKNLKLKGNVVHIDNRQNNLSQHGKMIIEFKGDGPKNVKLYPEVAGEFIVKLYGNDGNEIKDKFNEIEEGDKVKVVGKLLNHFDGETIKHRDGIITKIHYGSDEVPLKYDEEKKEYTAEIDITKDKKSVDAIAEYDGYFYYQSDLYIIEGIDRKPVVKEISEPEPEPEPEVVLPPPAPKIYSMEIEKNINKEVLSQKDIETFAITVIPKVDGKQVTLDEFKNLKLKIKTKLKGELLDQGNHWVYIPKIIQGKIDNSRPQGDYSFIANLKADNLDIKKQIDFKIAKLSFWENYGTFIIISIWLFLAIIILIGYIVRKSFKKNSVIIIKNYREEFRKPEITKKLSREGIQKILPYVRASMTIEGIVFYGEDPCVCITKKNLQTKFNNNLVKKLYINGEIVDKEELMKKDGKIYRNYNGTVIKVEYQDGFVKEYIYTTK